MVPCRVSPGDSDHLMTSGAIRLVWEALTWADVILEVLSTTFTYLITKFNRIKSTTFYESDVPRRHEVGQGPNNQGKMNEKLNEFKIYDGTKPEWKGSKRLCKPLQCNYDNPCSLTSDIWLWDKRTSKSKWEDK